MPAVSPSQQRLMAQAYQLKKGALKPEDINSEYRDQIVNLADSMTLQQLKDFAETKHSDMKKEGKVDEWVPGVAAGHKWYTQAAQAGAMYNTKVKDIHDNLIKSFMDFIESGDKKKKKDKVNEGGPAAHSSHSAPMATPANTQGMGNVTPPGLDTIGSGDRFDNDEEENDIAKKIGIMSYDDYKKWLKKWQKENQA